MNRELESELGFTQAEIDECLNRKGLLSLELEFTKQCNLRCIYCYSSAGQALEEELSFDELASVIEQARRLGAKSIILLGGGEPLLFPHIREVVRHIDSLGLSQAVFTNGMLLTKELCRFLYEHRVKVAIKCNSFLPEIQDGLAGVAGAHRLISRGLRLLLDSGYPGEGRPLCIQSIICPQNKNEIEEMWIWARAKGITPYFEMLTYQGRARQNTQLAISSDEIHGIFRRLSEVDRERFAIRWIPRPPIAGFTCRRHLYSCLVNSQGFVQPCTGVDVPVGNIREKPLGVILRESRIIQDLRGVYQRIDPTCRACRFAGACYGCRGNAFQSSGDYLAADPGCWLRSTRVSTSYSGNGEG